jgi:hypothetical protein
MSFDMYQAVADLRRDWDALPDVDKGEKIAEILANRLSKRTLSQAVKCDGKLIRDLALAAQGSPQEKAQARAGKISTRRLVSLVRSRNKQG